MIGPASNLKKGTASKWSRWITVGTGQTPGFSAYFNRGIVGAQFLSRQFNSQAEFTKGLTQDINSNRPNALRTFLSGPLRIALLDLLKTANSNGETIYSALYELNDPEVVSALTAFGKRCNLILASGAFNKKDKDVNKQTDENYKIRKTLRDADKINLFDRIVSGAHFAHNKFIVFCDKQGNPLRIWTGSTNTTVTGLCTQVNNGLLIESSDLASAYKTRWDELQAAKDGYPASLSLQGSTPAKVKLGVVPVTAWNVPCLKFVDLIDAKSYIQNAKQGVLFLMFNPGSGGNNGREFSLLQDIQALGQDGRYIRGVINQAQAAPKTDDPGAADSSVRFTAHNEIQDSVSTEAITPHAITVASKNWFRQEFHFSNVMIHSKVVVIDPFGTNPVVITGSHNLGPKASKSNDDNLVIIENAPGLAQEYAVNILGVYGHYRWLFNAWKTAKDAAPPLPAGSKKKPPVPVNPGYDGNKDSDAWQKWQMAGENLQLTQFLMGSRVTKITPAKAKKINAATRPSASPAVVKKVAPKKSARKQSVKKATK